MMACGVNPYALNVNGMLPICALCRRQVDSMTVNPASYGMAVRFTVRCHGAVEEATVPASTFHNLTVIERGFAFLGAVQEPWPTDSMQGMDGRTFGQ